MANREAQNQERGFNPNNLIPGRIYGMTNRKGDWKYKGYMKWSLYDSHGYYYFSNISNLFEILSTPLTANEVRNVIFEK